MKTIFTKNFLIGLGFIFIGSFANAQNGLQQIIVEKYYVSDAADSVANSTASISDGVNNCFLHKGSVTYRIYADMLPGYNFQMAYGDANHTLSINSTKSFYNNIDYGSTNPSYSKSNAAKNTVMLDSWLSVGAACSGSFGVLKTEDNSVATVTHPNGVLANNDVNAGIPLTTQDGIVAVTGRTPGVFASTPGLDLSVFDTCQTCNSFTTNSDSWYVAGGAVGPDSTINKVLIAQITTMGTLSFELNIQIGTPTGGVEMYVANNPVLNTFYNQMEISIPSLTYNSDSTYLSVQNKEVSNSIVNVFPNPAQDMLSLEIVPANQSSSNNSYTIFDILGKPLIHKELGMISGRHLENINISALTKGLYFIELSLNGVNSTKKIIKN